MRSHRGEAKARQAAHDLGLFRRAMRLEPPINWNELHRLETEQGTIRLSRPWLKNYSDRVARAVSRGWAIAKTGCTL